MKLRQIFLTFALALASASVLRAQPNPDQLKALYEDTLRQLQQSQDRKNQLANENEQLKRRIAELETSLDARSRQLTLLTEQLGDWAAFVGTYPLLLNQFQLAFGVDPDGAAASPMLSPALFFDPAWPFSAVTLSTDD